MEKFSHIEGTIEGRSDDSASSDGKDNVLSSLTNAGASDTPTRYSYRKRGRSAGSFFPDDVPISFLLCLSAAPLSPPDPETRSHFISSTPYTIRVCYGAPSPRLRLYRACRPRGDQRQIKHASREGNVLGQAASDYKWIRG